MMETDIRRINFFDGLFLRKDEFLAEQLYHLHMRRRVHYMLFERSGVVQLGSNELRIEPTAPPADKTFRVTAGTALSHRTDLREGREIVLKSDSSPIDLAAQGIAAGQQAFVAIHYEEALIEPQAGVTPNTETRVEERAVITVHDAAGGPPAPRPDGEPHVLLGRIDFDTMAVDESSRETAVLRSALIGAGPVTLVSIAVTPSSPTVTVGDSVALTATGTFSDGSSRALTAADGLTWTSDNAFATVDASGQVTGVAAGASTITAAVGAVSGSASVTVMPALGTPVIDPWSNPDRRRHGTETLTIRGDQFATPMTVAFLAATVGDPDVVVNATVVSINEATVVVPGPEFPTASDPAVVRSGPIRVTTAAGTSDPSPTAFILETT